MRYTAQPGPRYDPADHQYPGKSVFPQVSLVNYACSKPTSLFIDSSVAAPTRTPSIKTTGETEHENRHGTSCIVAFTPFLTVLSVVLPVSVCSVLIARIYRKNAALDPKITHKLRKQQEDYIDEVERKNRSLQNKLNSMQKGPELSEMGDLDGVLPELIGQLDGILPKWASIFI